MNSTSNIEEIKKLKDEIKGLRLILAEQRDKIDAVNGIAKLLGEKIAEMFKVIHGTQK